MGIQTLRLPCTTFTVDPHCTNRHYQLSERLSKITIRINNFQSLVLVLVYLQEDRLLTNFMLISTRLILTASESRAWSPPTVPVYPKFSSTDRPILRLASGTLLASPNSNFQFLKILPVLSDHLPPFRSSRRACIIGQDRWQNIFLTGLERFFTPISIISPGVHHWPRPVKV